MRVANKLFDEKVFRSILFFNEKSNISERKILGSIKNNK